MERGRVGMATCRRSRPTQKLSYSSHSIRGVWKGRTCLCQFSSGCVTTSVSFRRGGPIISPHPGVWSSSSPVFVVASRGVEKGLLIQSLSQATTTHSSLPDLRFSGDLPCGDHYNCIKVVRGEAYPSYESYHHHYHHPPLLRHRSCHGETVLCSERKRLFVSPGTTTMGIGAHSPYSLHAVVVVLIDLRWLFIS